MSRAGFQEPASSIEKLVRIVDRQKVGGLKAEALSLVDHKRVEKRAGGIGRAILSVSPA